MQAGLSCHLNPWLGRYSNNMTKPLQLVRRGRVAGCCAAALLVHYLAASWVGAGWVDASVGAPSAPTHKPASAPVFAELLAPEPALAEPTEASAAVPERQVQSVNTAQPVQPRREAKARYLTDVPPAVELTFSVVRAGAEGGAASGEAVLNWERDGAVYRLQYVAEVATGFGAQMSSEGRIGKAGIIPRTMTDKRRGRARTATHFNERGDITFSATQRVVPMLAGAQDKATWPLQLAGIARGASVQLEAGVELQVGEDKDASVYRFILAGQEEIVTGMGTVATWRLARLAAPGSYNARLDIWLAPGHEWYPVQLRSTEANGTVTTQTIRKIVVKDAGK